MQTPRKKEKLMSFSPTFFASRHLSKDFKINTLIYKTIMLHSVLCGCETWSLTLKQESRLLYFKTVSREKSQL